MEAASGSLGGDRRERCFLDHFKDLPDPRQRGKITAGAFSTALPSRPPEASDRQRQVRRSSGVDARMLALQTTAPCCLRWPPNGSASRNPRGAMREIG